MVRTQCGQQCTLSESCRARYQSSLSNYSPSVPDNFIIYVITGCSDRGNRHMGDPIYIWRTFSSFSTPFPLARPGILGISMSKVISADLSGRGLPQYATWSAAITLIVTIILNILFIPTYEIVGAAISSTIRVWAERRITYLLVSQGLGYKSPVYTYSNAERFPTITQIYNSPFICFEKLVHGKNVMIRVILDYTVVSQRSESCLWNFCAGARTSNRLT